MWPALLTFSLTNALPVLAGEIVDEQADPALRKPLPEFVAPLGAGDEETPVFSTEAPPPPPFDSTYQSPGPAADEEDGP